MIILRLFFLLVAGLLIRRLLHSSRPAGPSRTRPGRSATEPASPSEQEKYVGLTEQGIADADFEEIP
jgi:hypothetical protein